MDQVVGHTLFIVGIIFTFFVPGFAVVETFLPRLNRLYKFPLYMLLSVFFSSYVVYALSLLLGFSRLSILASFVIFVLWLGVLRLKKRKLHFSFPRDHLGSLAISLVIFAVFHAALSPAIFTPHGGQYVLAGPNWQDTAMHLGIIESISQGNFPPQAPYYAGVPLNYYYFTDFHSAILVSLKGEFFPRMLVTDNPFFAMMFFLSLYALGYFLTKNKKASIFAGFTGVFFSNMIFINFFKDLWGVKEIPALTDLLAHRSYSVEYAGLFQIPTMGDYFLQNRPMMVGLPAVVLVALLLMHSINSGDRKGFLMAGLISAMLIKFQYFAFGASLLIFALISIIYFKKDRFGQILLNSVIFVLPVIAALLFFISASQVNGNKISTLVLENFSWGLWDKDISVYQYLQFIFFNLGLPFLFSLATAIMITIRIVSGRRLNKERLLLCSWVLILFLIPSTMSFTIYPQDMFKFFHFMAIPASILTGIFLSHISGWGHRGTIPIVLILFISTGSSFLTLANSYFNKNVAYSSQDMLVGGWIRKNTPQRSVFISLPTVHTPITQIGGRLRVLSYINWPHSHGYNYGDDNVFVRLEDVQKLYDESTDGESVLETIDKYQVDYIYYGREEKENFPQAKQHFDSLPFLKSVYRYEDITIYEVIHTR